MFDVLAGIILSAGGLGFLPGNGFVLSLGIIMLLKGGWFLLAALSKGNGRSAKSIIESLLDLVAGLLVFSVFSGFFHPLFAIIGVLVLIKGAWYLVEGLAH